MIQEPRFSAKRYTPSHRKNLPTATLWGIWDNVENIFIEVESYDNMITASTLKSHIDDFVRDLNSTARYVIERFPIILLTYYGIWDHENSEFVLVGGMEQNIGWNGKKVSAFGVIDSEVIGIVEKLNNPI